MLKIEIIDPQNLDQKTLIQTARYLLAIAGHGMEEVAEVTPAVSVSAPEAPSTSNIELDSSGKPWDSRLHSRTRSKNDDGTWKLIRGKVASNSAPVVLVAPPAALMQKATPTPPPPPAPIVVPFPETLDDLRDNSKADFDAVIDKVSNAIAEKKITRDQINAVCQSVGIPSLGDLSTNTHLIPKLMTALSVITG